MQLSGVPNAMNGNDWKMKVEELRERAQQASDRTELQAAADACEVAGIDLEVMRKGLTKLIGEIDLAQAQLRAEAMRMRDRLKGVPVVKLNGAA